MTAKNIKIEKYCKVGIYDNCSYIARIYADKIIITSPYVRWRDNSGVYAERKERITDMATVDIVRRAVSTDQESLAWAAIGRALSDPYLEHSAAN